MSADLQPMLLMVCETCRGDNEDHGAECVRPECVGWLYANVCAITPARTREAMIAAAAETLSEFAYPGLPLVGAVPPEAVAEAVLRAAGTII